MPSCLRVRDKRVHLIALFLVQMGEIVQPVMGLSRSLASHQTFIIRHNNLGSGLGQIQHGYWIVCTIPFKVCRSSVSLLVQRDHTKLGGRVGLPLTLRCC